VVESSGERNQMAQGQTGGARQQENPWAAETEGMPDSWDFPKHGLTVTDETPPDAVIYRALDGTEFKAPPEADWFKVYEAGKANGMNP